MNDTNGNGIIKLSHLRKQLAVIRNAQDALDLAQQAERTQKAYQLIGSSVADCNECAEIYLLAYWKFGELVRDNREGRPKKLPIDGEFSRIVGTDRQREYAKRFQKAALETDISEYVHAATEQMEAASIAGCLEWADPGRHGNLKGEYEWYTPTAIIEAAREVMGGIDLDPASCEQANNIVQATEYFSEEDSGLEKTWHGRIFINPPFAHPTVKYFAEKLLDSLAQSQISQAIWLSNACVDVDWWHSLASRGVTCFHRGRIQFYGPDGKQQPPTLGQTIIYLGLQQQKFAEIFSAFGLVLS
jgi:hypothetical protein